MDTALFAFLAGDPLTRSWLASASLPTARLAHRLGRMASRVQRWGSTHFGFLALPC